MGAAQRYQSEIITGDGFISDAASKFTSGVRSVGKRIAEEASDLKHGAIHYAEDRSEFKAKEEELLNKIKELQPELNRLLGWYKQFKMTPPTPGAILNDKPTIAGDGKIAAFINEKANRDAEKYGQRLAALNKELRALVAYIAVLKKGISNGAKGSNFDNHKPSWPHKTAGERVVRKAEEGVVWKVPGGVDYEGNITGFGLEHIHHDVGRYGRVHLSPTLGGTGKPKKKPVFLDSDDSAAREDILGLAQDELAAARKERASAAKSNNLASMAGPAGLAIAGADAVGSLANSIGDQVDQGRKTTHAIQRENGELEKEKEKNRLEMVKLKGELIRDMKHKRYWDFSDFSPSKLKLSRFGFKNKEQVHDPKFAEQLNKADDALEEYVDTMIEKMAEKKEKELDRMYARKNGGGVPMSARDSVMGYGDGVNNFIRMSKHHATIYGRGDASSRGRVALAYPNPDMMSGMMSK